MKLYKLAPFCALLVLALLSSGCSRLKARDELNKGVASYRNAQFQTAIMHFKEAVRLDPNLLNARLYLATAYAQQYIPGGESAENLKVAQQAIDAFQDVLRVDPNNLTAIASIAQIYYNEKNFEKAKEFQRRRLQLDPNNPEPYYWIGVLNWAIAYPREENLRKDLKINLPKNPQDPDSRPPIPEKDRAKLEEENGPLVKEGLEVLSKAIQLKPNDFDTMAYLNLMYRQKAELDGDATTRAEDLKTAQGWVEKAMAIRQRSTQGTATASQ